jgi:transposase
MWMQGTTITALAKEIGVCQQTASERAQRLRERGVALPARPGRYAARYAESTARLNAIIEQETIAIKRSA